MIPRSEGTRLLHRCKQPVEVTIVEDNQGSGENTVLSDQQLELVANHGSGPLERALATVMLAKRRDRLDELRDLIADTED